MGRWEEAERAGKDRAAVSSRYITWELRVGDLPYAPKRRRLDHESTLPLALVADDEDIALAAELGVQADPRRYVLRAVRNGGN